MVHHLDSLTKLAVAAISKRRWRLPAKSGRPDLNEALAIYNFIPQTKHPLQQRSYPQLGASRHAINFRSHSEDIFV